MLTSDDQLSIVRSRLSSVMKDDVRTLCQVEETLLCVSVCRNNCLNVGFKGISPAIGETLTFAVVLVSSPKQLEGLDVTERTHVESMKIRRVGPSTLPWGTPTEGLAAGEFESTRCENDFTSFDER